MAGMRCTLFAVIATLAGVSAQYMFAYAPLPPAQQQQEQQAQTQAPVRTPYGLPAQSSAFAGRQQRSLFGGGGGGGGGWHGIGGVSSIGVDHITKEELIALVDAWKEVEANEPAKKPAPAPEPEPEPEPEEEAEPEPEEEEEAAEPAKPAEPAAGPPAGVPLTVSLPAFVPIQLSAMYTAPAPVGPPAAGGGGGGGGGAAGGGGEEAGEGGEGGGGGGEAEAHKFRFARPLGGSRNTLGGGARAKPKQFKPNNSARSGTRRSKPGPSIRFPIQNPRSFASANYIAPKPRYYRTPGPFAAPSQTDSISALPPPSFLANAPGPLQLVPSTDLMSNWN